MKACKQRDARARTHTHTHTHTTQVEAREVLQEFKRQSSLYRATVPLQVATGTPHRARARTHARKRTRMCACADARAHARSDGTGTAARTRTQASLTQGRAQRLWDSIFPDSIDWELGWSAHLQNTGQMPSGDAALAAGSSVPRVFAALPARKVDYLLGLAREAAEAEVWWRARELVAEARLEAAGVSAKGEMMGEDVFASRP